MWLKICGVTDAQSVAAALETGVDAIGFVFAPSVRSSEPSQAARLAVPARGRLSLIAVTLHPEAALIEEILRQLRPDVLQSDLADFEHLILPATLGRLPVLRSAVDPPAALPRRFLFEGARSGHGETADWTLGGSPCEPS